MKYKGWMEVLYSSSPVSISSYVTHLPSKQRLGKALSWKIQHPGEPYGSSPRGSLSLCCSGL